MHSYSHANNGATSQLSLPVFSFKTKIFSWCHFESRRLSLSVCIQSEAFMSNACLVFHSSECFASRIRRELSELYFSRTYETLNNQVVEHVVLNGK